MRTDSSTTRFPTANAARVAAAGLLFVAAATASAETFEIFDFTNVASIDTQGDVNNVVLSVMVDGGFDLGFIDFRGIWTNPDDVPTRGDDTMVLVTPPISSGGSPVKVTLAGGGFGIPDDTKFRRSRFDFANLEPAGEWTFEFFELTTDVENLPDMVWSDFQIAFTNDTQPQSLVEMSSKTVTRGSIVNANNGEGSPAGPRSFLDGPNGFSGIPGEGIWDSNENVFELQWSGGDLIVNLSPDTPDDNLDLIIFSDAKSRNVLDSSLEPSGPETIFVPALDSGTYWIVVDGVDCGEADYTLSVIPSPGTATLAALAIVAASPRRTRKEHTRA